MAYKDRTFCSNPDCDNSCGRKFYNTSEEEVYRKFCEDIGFNMGISFADFHKNKELGRVDSEERSKR